MKDQNANEDALANAIRECAADAHDALEYLYERGGESDEAWEQKRKVRTALELVRCLGRVVKGRTVRELHDAFGAPGDFGYDTPLGDALARAYGVVP